MSGGWILRLSAGAAFSRQLREAGLVHRAVVLVAAHGLQFGLWIFSWYLIGRGALGGEIDPGWLVAWALLLATVIPVRLFGDWWQGRLVIDFGILLKKRLLAGALRLPLDEIRRRGSVPHTLTTNEPEKVREFAAAHPEGIVTKMMTPFAVYDEQGRENVVFTTPLAAEDLADLNGLELSPMTFQERVPKALELRVTVVGHQVFAASMVDEWKVYDLPAEVGERLLRLCDRLGLNYGAIDLILTPDGRHVFLEVNPVGEYFWLEHWPGFPISEAIAEVLVDPSKRRLPGVRTLAANG